MLNKKIIPQSARKRVFKKLNQEHGNAMIEIIPILTIFILIVNFSLGFFGLIHSGILNSIGARNYAFETFRNRSNLRYLRDIADSESSFTYTKPAMRFHTVINETIPTGGSAERFYATRRPIQFTDVQQIQNPSGNSAEHEGLKKIQEGARATETGSNEGVSPAWVRTMYGICLNAKCGQ